MGVMCDTSYLQIVNDQKYEKFTKIPEYTLIEFIISKPGECNIKILLPSAL